MTQQTLAEPIYCSGVGLHTGAKVEVTLRPAPPDSGVSFVRTDLPGRPRIRASVENVVDTRFATTLGEGGVQVMTVEHLLSGFYGMGVDNVAVEISGPEVPILDGSSASFVYMLRCAGIRRQSRARRTLVPLRPLRVTEGDRSVEILPGGELEVECSIDYDHPKVRSQHLRFVHHNGNYETEVSRARTFGFLSELESLRRMGLARGGSLDNAVVIGNFEILNREGLRYPDEFVRHKVLDLMGDLSLLGMRLRGRVVAKRSGHSVHHKFLKELLATPDAWEVTTGNAPKAGPVEPILRLRAAG